MRKLNEIIIHCTATRPGWWQGKPLKAKINEIRRWHTEERGWSDIGYHYLIDRDGKVGTGRDVSRDGAHVRGRNKNTIGVSLFGGHGGSEQDKFEDNFTPEQDRALRELLDDLQAKYGKMKISGHNQYAAKACPTFQVDRWLKKKPPVTTDKEVRGEAGTAIGAGVGAAAAAAAVGLSDYSSSTVWIAVGAVLVGGVLVLMWLRNR